MRASLFVLLAALAAVPQVQAVTSISLNSPEQRPGVTLGVVEQQLMGQLKIDGKTYQFTLPSARVYDRNGATVQNVRLPSGTKVAYALATEGGTARIAYLWIL